MITTNSDDLIGAKRILAHACAGDVVTIASGQPITGNSRIFESKKPTGRAATGIFIEKSGGISSEDS
jgi:hypothetical protein